MNYSILALIIGIALLLCLPVPATCAVTPSWTETVTEGTELSGVAISGDGSLIVTGGDHLTAFSRSGKTLWTAGSGSLIDIGRDGKNVLVAQRQSLRLLSGDSGTVVWDRPFDSVITDISMAADASLVAASGASQIRTLTGQGTEIATNASMAVNHIRVTPSGREIIVTSPRGLFFEDSRLVSTWSNTGAPQDLLEVSRDGTAFVTATSNVVRMYSGSGTSLWEEKLPHGNALALAYSKDGSTVVVGMDDTTIRVLNNRGILLWTANATNWITSVAVSDDGSTIAAGGLDKKVHVFNHAGIREGVFSAQNPIDPRSIAVSGDGSLIVVASRSAVYGFSRSSFTQETVGETVTETLTPTTEETPFFVPTVTTSRRPTSRLPTVPTPYPTSTETPESPLWPVVPATALGLVLLYRAGKR